MVHPVINQRICSEEPATGDAKRARRNSPAAGLSGQEGFSLPEMMIALLILSVSILGFTSLILTSIQVNYQNDLRNTAIKLTSETAEILLAQPIDYIITGGLTPYNNTNTALGSGLNAYKKFPNPDQTVRGHNVPYTVTWTATSLTDYLKKIEIAVRYTYKGRELRNDAVVYKNRAM